MQLRTEESKITISGETPTGRKTSPLSPIAMQTKVEKDNADIMQITFALKQAIDQYYKTEELDRTWGSEFFNWLGVTLGLLTDRSTQMQDSAKQSEQEAFKSQIRALLDAKDFQDAKIGSAALRVVKTVTSGVAACGKEQKDPILETVRSAAVDYTGAGTIIKGAQFVNKYLPETPTLPGGALPTYKHNARYILEIVEQCFEVEEEKEDPQKAIKAVAAVKKLQADADTKLKQDSCKQAVQFLAREAIAIITNIAKAKKNLNFEAPEEPSEPVATAADEKPTPPLAAPTPINPLAQQVLALESQLADEKKQSEAFKAQVEQQIRTLTEKIETDTKTNQAEIKKISEEATADVMRASATLQAQFAADKEAQAATFAKQLAVVRYEIPANKISSSISEFNQRITDYGIARTQWKTKTKFYIGGSIAHGILAVVTYTGFIAAGPPGWILGIASLAILGYAAYTVKKARDCKTKVEVLTALNASLSRLQAQISDDKEKLGAEGKSAASGAVQISVADEKQPTDIAIADKTLAELNFIAELRTFILEVDRCKSKASALCLSAIKNVLDKHKDIHSIATNLDTAIYNIKTNEAGNIGFRLFGTQDTQFTALADKFIDETLSRVTPAPQRRPTTIKM